MEKHYIVYTFSIFGNKVYNFKSKLSVINLIGMCNLLGYKYEVHTINYKEEMI